MAILRQEKQQYVNLAAIMAETLIPSPNDQIGNEETRQDYQWIQGSTKTHDGIYVLDVPAVSALGRWEMVGASNIYQSVVGANTSSALENGQQEELDITVTGALVARANLVAVTSASTFPSGVFIISKEVIANDTVRVVLENQTGDAISAQTIDLTVVEF